MRCYEVAHVMDALLRRVEVMPENRILILDYVRSGYDESGNLIIRSGRSGKVLRCVDCPDKDEKCESCPIESF
jgi:hypothetical protein